MPINAEAVKMKQKKCKGCGNKFTPYNSLQKACSPRCALDIVEAEKQKAFKRETRERKEKLKTRSDWMREAQIATNRYIRARDRVYAKREGRYPECCSCGTTNQDIQYAAGHFKTVGAYPELRFNEFNIHIQCNKRCNKELSGNIHGTKDTRGYHKFIVEKYGEMFIDEITNRPIPHYTIAELKEIKKLYNYFANQLEKELTD